MRTEFSILTLFFIIVATMTGCSSGKSEHDKMIEFGQKYADAWNSKNPEKMASFYAEDGMLTVNEGTPAVGREQIAKTAQSYMEGFPDMELTMDSLTSENGKYRFYWTFKGTHTGPGGTGNKVDFSGFEEWTMNEQGLVQISDGSYDESEYGKATKELIALVDSDPALKSMLESSIQKAKEINPDRNTNPAQSLEEYYAFVTWTETTMPWALLKKEEYPEIFDNIFQGLCAFYFLIDQPLPELEGKDLVNNSLQYYEPFANWLVTFSKSWGAYLDTEDSWNEAYYQMALNDPNFGLQHGWYEDPSNWNTFNQFFARYLKSPDMRPIASPDMDSVVVSFADSQPQGVWAIDDNSNLMEKEGVPVKSATLKSISKLIGDDSAYKDAFVNGTFTHSFLNVNDYHRYHFPLSGTIKEVRIIQGINPTGGELGWDQENKRYAFNPHAKTGWQSVETRGCVIMETADYGLVALLPIGMVAVGSVNFEDNVKPGAKVKKGDMLGHFAFGGSDFIMIFQEGVTFTLNSPMDDDGHSYKHILMGERLGLLSKEK